MYKIQVQDFKDQVQLSKNQVQHLQESRSTMFKPTSGTMSGKKGGKYPRIKTQIPRFKNTGLTSLSSQHLVEPHAISSDSIQLQNSSKFGTSPTRKSTSQAETEKFLRGLPKPSYPRLSPRNLIHFSDTQSLPVKSSANKSVKDLIPDYSTIHLNESQYVGDNQKDIPETNSVASLLKSTKSAPISPTPLQVPVFKNKPFVWDDYLNQETYHKWFLQYVIPEQFKEQAKTVFGLMNNARNFKDLLHNFEFLDLEMIVTLFPNKVTYYQNLDGLICVFFLPAIVEETQKAIIEPRMEPHVRYARELLENYMTSDQYQQIKNTLIQTAQKVTLLETTMGNKSQDEVSVESTLPSHM